MSNSSLGRKTLVSYGLGSAAPTAAYEFIGAFLLLFYTKLVGLDPAWIGYAFLTRMIIDTAVDPAIGYLSDRTRFAAGRRRPYFLIGSLPGILLFWLLFAPPAGSAPLRLGYLTAVSSLMVVFLSLTAIPHMAMSFEITTDYDERVRVVGYRNFVETIASLLALLSVPLASKLEGSLLLGHTVSGADCYRIAAVVLGSICLLTTVIAYFGTSEKQCAPHECRFDFRDGILAAVRNKPFLILLIVFALVSIANRVQLAQLFLLLEHFHGKRENETMPVVLSFYVGSLGSIAVWMFLGRRLGKNRALRAALIGWPLTFIALVSRRWSDVGLCTVGLLMGAFICGILAMLGAIAPDALDADRSQSGQRREGVYASVANLVLQAGLGVGYLITGLTLHAVGFRGGVNPTPVVVDGLRISVASFPVILGWGAFVAFWFFPITKESHKILLRDLSAKASES